jgi:hypothetical protein
MAADISARLTQPRHSGRRFGLEIGIASGIAGVLLLRKQHSTIGISCIALSFILVACAWARPSALEPAARRWLAFAAALARVSTPVVLALLYFIVVTPMAILRRTLGKSPFRRDRSAATYWVASTRRTAEEQRARMERQF